MFSALSYLRTVLILINPQRMTDKHFSPLHIDQRHFKLQLYRVLYLQKVILEMSKVLQVPFVEFKLRTDIWICENVLIPDLDDFRVLRLRDEEGP